MIKIFLADDHDVVRHGLRALFDHESDISVVGEASKGNEVMALVVEKQPDILVLDVMMPGLNGLEVTRQVIKRIPYLKVIILSMHANDAYVLKAIKNGAVGYVLKDSSINEMVNAVREVANGKRYLSPPLAENIDIYEPIAPNESTDRYDLLTEREREIFQLTAEGKSSTKIGKILTISPRTVETHRTNFMKKLNLNNQAELIRYALRRGIIPLEG